MPEIVQEIGSYAGFAAVVGLAVLSALYFSQARDVKRLREWAGRAPERAAEQEQRIQAAAQQAQAPAAAAAAGAKPASVAQPAPAQQGAAPAVQPVPGKVAAQAPAPATAPGKAGAQAPVPGKAPVPAAGPAGAATAQPAQGQTATKAPPVITPRPAATGAGPRPAAGNKTSILPPSARPRPPWHRRIHWPAPRYIVLLVVGLLVVGGGAAYGVSELLGEGETTRTAPAANGGEGGEGGGRPARINPSTVTVSVLNGTTVPGLAAQIADKVESGGFQRGNVANATEQQRAESVVFYARGASREARAVARRLRISQIEQVDADTQALAGDATVIVVVGADRTQ
jgi:hypothetical protein